MELSAVFAISCLMRHRSQNKGKTMNFEESAEVHLKVDFVMYRINTFASFTQNCRKNDGLVYYMRGGHKVQDENAAEYTARESQLLYLPFGSRYTSNLLEDGTEYYEIDFSLYQDGKQVSLMDRVRVLSRASSVKYFNEIKEIYDLSVRKSPNYQMVIMSKLLGLCSVLLNENLITVEKNEGFEKIRRSISYILEHFDESITVEDLARISYMSVSTLEKNFRLCFGETPAEYMNRIRMEYAKTLLQGGFGVSEVAQRVGFSNRNYFTNVFKKYTGTTPGKYRDELTVDVE